MHFEYSEKVKDLQARLNAFMDEHVYPNEQTVEEFITRGPTRWTIPPIIEELKPKAKAADSGISFSPSEHGAGLTNLEYAPLCEIMGRSLFAAEALQLLGPRHRQHGSARALRHARTQKKAVARAAAGRRDPLGLRDDRAGRRVVGRHQHRVDASTRDGDDYVINGTKWWTSGAGDPRCKIVDLHGQDRPERPEARAAVDGPRAAGHARHRDRKRMLTVFGYDDAPHGHAEVEFKDVRVPKTNILLGEGRGFEIAQGRLGPGRIHHCMRTIGIAERALELMCQRATSRTAFGTHARRDGRDAPAHRALPHGDRAGAPAHAQGRLHDGHGRQQGGALGDREDQGRRAEHGPARHRPRDAGPRRGWACRRIFPLAHIFAGMRALRIVDGPDEVHRAGSPRSS